MKKLVIFLIGLTTVFSLSAQRLNSRGEKMVSHIRTTPMTDEKKVGADYPYPADIYFYYDSNDEINKVKAINPLPYTDSIVITKGKNGIIWKDYYKKDNRPPFPYTHKVFLDDKGRVSKVEGKLSGQIRSEVLRRIYNYVEKSDDNICLDVENHIIYQPVNGPEYPDGFESTLDQFRGYEFARYDGGLLGGCYLKSPKTKQYLEYHTPGWYYKKKATIIDKYFPNETNVEFYSLLMLSRTYEEDDWLLLLTRWIPIKADFLPREFKSIGSKGRYTDCIYNRNGVLTNIEVYLNASYSAYFHGIYLENIEIEYVQ